MSAETVDVVADMDKVKNIRNEVQQLLKQGQVQAARHLLAGLASEVVISVNSIPLATYPAAIKKAVLLIDKGKQDEAKEVLKTALNTLVIRETIIPLPVIITQELLKQAEKLAEKTNRQEEENKQLASLLTHARQELEFAEILGYGSKQDFKNIYEQLDQIENKTSGGKSGTGFFAAIKKYLQETVKSSQPKFTPLTS